MRFFCCFPAQLTVPQENEIKDLYKKAGPLDKVAWAMTDEQNIEYNAQVLTQSNADLYWNNPCRKVLYCGFSATLIGAPIALLLAYNDYKESQWAKNVHCESFNALHKMAIDEGVLDPSNAYWQQYRQEYLERTDDPVLHERFAWVLDPQLAAPNIYEEAFDIGHGRYQPLSSDIAVYEHVYDTVGAAILPVDDADEPEQVSVKFIKLKTYT
jgi:hypothetical protein